MTDSLPIHFSNDPNTSIFGPRHLTQAMVIVCIVLCCLLFQAVARWMAFPAEPYFKGSLLQSPVNVGALLMGLVTLAICAALSDLIVGRRWFLAGLFVATASLATWSVRGGRTQYVLLRADSYGSGRGVFAAMLIEHLFLSAAVAGLWIWLWAKHEAQSAAQTNATPEDEGRSTGPALLAQVGATVLILLVLLGETGVKKQVMVSVFLAGMGGTAVAQGFFASHDTGRWYWIGPTVAGVIGYLIAFFQPTGIEIGHLSGFLAALSRPLPIDYASLGMAGALLGYWVNGLISSDTQNDMLAQETSADEKAG